jgi:thiol-disulfide isomerase/thioredoxin
MACLSKSVRFSSRFLLSLAILLPFASFRASDSQAAGINWHKNLVSADREATSRNKPLLVMVDAPWCGYCRKMLAQTFPDPAVAARINAQFIPVLINADEQPALVQSLKVDAMPTVLVVAPGRKIVARLTGFQTAAQLDARLASLGTASSAPQIRPIPPAPVTSGSGGGAIAAARAFWSNPANRQRTYEQRDPQPQSPPGPSIAVAEGNARGAIAAARQFWANPANRQRMAEQRDTLTAAQEFGLGQ